MRKKVLFLITLVIISMFLIGCKEQSGEAYKKLDHTKKIDYTNMPPIDRPIEECVSSKTVTCDTTTGNLRILYSEDDCSQHYVDLDCETGCDPVTNRCRPVCDESTTDTFCDDETGDLVRETKHRDCEITSETVTDCALACDIDAIECGVERCVDATTRAYIDESGVGHIEDCSDRNDVWTSWTCNLQALGRTECVSSCLVHEETGCDPETGNIATISQDTDCARSTLLIEDCAGSGCDARTDSCGCTAGSAGCLCAESDSPFCDSATGDMYLEHINPDCTITPTLDYTCPLDCLESTNDCGEERCREIRHPFQSLRYYIDESGEGQVEDCWERTTAWLAWYCRTGADGTYCGYSCRPYSELQCNPTTGNLENLFQTSGCSGGFVTGSYCSTGGCEDCEGTGCNNATLACGCVEGTPDCFYPVLED